MWKRLGTAAIGVAVGLLMLPLSGRSSEACVTYHDWYKDLWMWPDEWKHNGSGLPPAPGWTYDGEVTDRDGSEYHEGSEGGKAASSHVTCDVGGGPHN
jgi:hypothetical protein